MTLILIPLGCTEQLKEFLDFLDSVGNQVGFDNTLIRDVISLHHYWARFIDH